MRASRKAAAAAISSILALCLWVAAAAGRDATPNIGVFNLDNPPLALSYFRGSDIAVFHDVDAGVIYRSPDGGFTWAKVDDVPEGAAVLLVLHEFDDTRGYIITPGPKHWITTNRGETWKPFSTDIRTTAFQSEILRFHAADPDRVLFHGMVCEGRFCGERTMYTTDGFASVHLLLDNTDGCWWAKSAELFTTGQETLDRDRVLCIARDTLTGARAQQRLVISDDFFKRAAGGDVQEYEPNLDTDRAVQGVVNIGIVKKHILVATSSLNTDEMALFVTGDTIRWHRAMFSLNHDHRVRQEAYTVLEGTEHSIQIDVMFSHPFNPMGALFTSNSNGTYFTESLHYTNRNPDGRVDFENISGVQGVFLVNSVDNGDEVEFSFAVQKRIVSQISFDGGRTLEPVHTTSDRDRIHLHSFTELDNTGKVFSSPAPGLVMGNGNTGKALGSYQDANLYVSDDAGLTWRQALKGAHKYEFGDQGSVLVAVRDSFADDVTEYWYSLNHGQDWAAVPLPAGLKVQPLVLTTTQQSAGLKFILIGRSAGDSKTTHHIIAIDFSGLHESTCGDGDMEDWHARVNHDGQPTCVMGHKQTYRRRKKDARCFMNKPFTAPAPKSEPCECDDVDFECDYNFVRDEGGAACKLAGPLSAPSGSCARPEDTFKGPSGWRKIPGNQCRDGKKKDEPVDRSCKDAAGGGPSSPTSDKPKNAQKLLSSGFNNMQKFYLERGDSSSTNDETVIARGYRWTGGVDAVPDSKIWLTRDHGKSWEQILPDEKVVDIFPHQYFKDVVFFTTRDSSRVIYTVDRGEHFHEFDAPLTPDEYPLSYHPDRKDWLIWTGRRHEKVGGDKVVREAFVSTSRGYRWDPLLPDPVDRCEFTGQSAFKFRPSKQIICLARESSSDGRRNMIGSDDFFVEHTDELVKDVKNFATMAEFIVVAAEDGDHQGLKALTSIDGKSFEEARFPLNSVVPHENAYTVLDSSSHAIRLFVATHTAEGRRYGNIVKSNSNGTSYVRIAEAVNCNDDYFVDFEKITGLEGVLLINTVVNTDRPGEAKTLQTKISHNDGAEWGFLAPPAADSEGQPYPCKSGRGGVGDEGCALHLHHYTEREDKSKTFSASSAIGVMFGIGNVGPSLGPIQDADTFLTSDGGVTWKSVAKGPWTWQFGDQGSLLVLVRRHTGYSRVRTRTVLYSTDEGDSWREHAFSDKEAEVLDITALRSGSSRNMLVWTRDGDDVSAVNVDFTGLYDGPCKNPKVDDGDYYLWSPKHPLQNDDCFFGHVSKYYRKKKGQKCYNDQTLDHLYQVSNCECSRRDYECGYNFEMDNAGQCRLVPEHEPLSADQWCSQNPNASTWYEPTGYRKLALSTCVGGNELDKASRPHPCPGREQEFEREHRISGVALFFAIAIPIAAAAAAGLFVWRKWDGKFGQIRLGEAAVDEEPPWVRYPVIAVSVVVALVAAIPVVAASLSRIGRSLYERVRGFRPFTTRDSFARGRGDYSVVVEDEGELLGDDSDEEA